MTRPLKKDPAAEKTFFADWEGFLDGRTLVSSSWAVPDGIQKLADTKSETVSYVKISGGIVGETYELDCSITMSDGDKDHCNLFIYVEERSGN